MGKGCAVFADGKSSVTQAATKVANASVGLLINRAVARGGQKVQMLHPTREAGGTWPQMQPFQALPGARGVTLHLHTGSSSSLS